MTAVGPGLVNVAGTTLDTNVFGIINVARAWQAESPGNLTQPTRIPQLYSVSNPVTGENSYDSPIDGWEITTHSIYALQSYSAKLVNIERWHDNRWTSTPLDLSPFTDAPMITADGVEAVSADNAWVVGATYRPGLGGTYGVLIQHWDGHDWKTVSNPDKAKPGDLRAVRAVSSNDVWAVGVTNLGAGTPIRPLIQHWNGRTWSDIVSPPTTGNAVLNAVSVRNAHDIWAVGAQSDPASGAATALVEHWDGTSWSIVDGVPDIDAFPSGEVLQGVFAAGVNDVWATAQVGGLGSGAVDNFLHWDGTSWTIVPVPGAQEFGQNTQYTSIDGTGPDDVWAAGSIADLGANTLTPRLAHLTC